MTETKYILFEEDNDTTKLFDSEDELQEYLEEEGYSGDDLESVRVFEVDSEYRVKPSYELEEV